MPKENPFERTQGVVRFVLDRFEVPVSTTEEGDVQELLEVVRSGHCQACASPLAEHTVLIVGKAGPVAAYCCGACLQDQANIGWLQEQHADIVSAIQFRNPDNHPDDAD